MKMRRVKLDPDLCISCKRCVTACAIRHSKTKDVNSMMFEYPIPYARMKLVLKKNKPAIQKCIHCKKPNCMEVCETGAIYIQEGLVLVNYEKCVGCWKCVSACKFNAIIKDERLNIPVRCDTCYEYDDLACVTACRTGALTMREV